MGPAHPCVGACSSAGRKALVSAVFEKKVLSMEELSKHLADGKHEPQEKTAAPVEEAGPQEETAAPVEETEEVTAMPNMAEPPTTTALPSTNTFFFKKLSGMGKVLFKVTKTVCPACVRALRCIASHLLHCVPSQLEGQLNPDGSGRPYRQGIFLCTRYDIAGKDDDSLHLEPLENVYTEQKSHCFCKYHTLLCNVSPCLRCVSWAAKPLTVTVVALVMPEGKKEKGEGGGKKGKRERREKERGNEKKEDSVQ